MCKVRKKGRALRIQLTVRLAVCATVLLFMSVAALVYANRLMQSAVTEATDLLLEKTRQSVESFFDDMSRVVNNVSFSAASQELLHLEDPARRITEVSLRENVRSILLNAIMYKDSIVGVLLLDDQMRVVCEAGNTVSYEDNELPTSIPDTAVYSRGYNKMASPSWTNLRPPYFHLFAPVYFLDRPREKAGMLMFTLTPRDFGAILQDSAPSDNASLLLIDNYGMLMAVSRQRGIRNENAIFVPGQMMPPIGALSGNISRELTIDKTGWMLRAVIPQDDLTANLRGLTAFMIGVCALSLAALGYLTVFTGRQITRPMRELTRFVRTLREHKEQRLSLMRDDEFGEMAEALNQALDEVVRLNSERYKAELNRKQWELDAIRSQINPHFLYNTLEYVRGMALYRGVPELADTVMALSRLMRYSIKGGYTATIGSEIDNLKRYAAIIGSRFEMRIRVEIDCPEELKSVRAPHMLLQPLVENAVIHGLEGKEQGGVVHVEVGRAECGLFYYDVADDGLGMPEEKLSLIRSYAQDAGRIDSDHVGLGLISIIRHLDILFGGEARVTIESREGEGTHIRMIFPEVGSR